MYFPYKAATFMGSLVLMLLFTLTVAGNGIMAQEHFNTPIPLVSSTFDKNDAGWTVVGDAQGGLSIPDYFVEGGNPDGYVSATDDVTGGAWYW